MPYVKLTKEKLESDFPLILAGPILRRVTEDSVTVWLALKEKSTVTLKIRAKDTPNFLFEATAETRKIATYLHLVAVTAKAGTDKLKPATLYEYDLEFTSQSFPGKDLKAPKVFATEWHDADLCYNGFSLPSFVLPPVEWRDLHFLHGSCRKLHAAKEDAVRLIDAILLEAAGVPAQRHQMLFLTGDQIYADDVADALLQIIIDVGNVLFTGMPSEVLAELSGNPGQLAPGNREEVIDKVCMIPTPKGERKKYHPTKSHLIFFREFCAMYLMAWSGLFWPRSLSDYPSVPSPFGKFGKDDLSRLDTSAKAQTQLRRALANIATYMILDDHEITDDCFISANWCAAVLGKEAGRQLVRNGLTAYAIFQGWGNSPDQFTSGQPGGDLLDTLATLPSDRDSRLDAALGIPPKNHVLELKDSEVTFHRESGRSPLLFYYALNFGKYQFLVLDGRMWRSYRGKDGSSQGDLPCQTISDAGIARQITQQDPGTPIEITFVVSPLAPLGVPTIEFFQDNSDTLDLRLKRDVESWNAAPRAFPLFLAKLASRPLVGVVGSGKLRRIVVLSGDVHHGYAARLAYWARKPYGGPPADPEFHSIFAFLIASSLKNPKLGRVRKFKFDTTENLHHHGYEALRVLNKRDWKQYFGWENPRSVRFEIGERLTTGGSRLFWEAPAQSPVVLCAERYKVDQLRGPFTTPSEWRYRVTFLDGFGRLPETLPKIKDEDKASYKSCLKEHRRCARYYGSATGNGSQIVGLTNVGEITFKFDDSSSDTRVGQWLWWYNPEGNQVGRTLHIVDLRLIPNPEYPDPEKVLVSP